MSGVAADVEVSIEPVAIPLESCGLTSFIYAFILRCICCMGCFSSPIVCGVDRIISCLYICMCCGEQPCILPADEKRRFKNGGEASITYGEITPRGFRNLAEYISLSTTDTFCDLGSGTGT